MTEEQEQFIIQYRKRKLQESIQRRERAAERRRKLDHERYMRSREERKARQRDYYLQNRESILTKKKLKYQEQIWYSRTILSEKESTTHTSASTRA